MFTKLAFRRLLAATTAFGMVLPPVAASAQDDSSAAPPSRVGQISVVNGQVSFNGAGSGGWAAATLNYPVSAGDSIYTQQGATAAIALDASTITLAENTELQMTGLTDTAFGATEAQGEAFLNLTDLQPGEDFTLSTPRGNVTISQNGQYDIAAGDANTPTTVTVFSGAATVSDSAQTLPVAAGQAAVLTGANETSAQLTQAQPDQFAQSLLAAAPPAPVADAPPVVEQMTGGTALAQYGDWAPDPEYGAIWYPSVAVGWAPYREGHWADVEPWGWTWIDAEPWGFAPFHYGRWLQVGGRWGWIPADGGGYGRQYRPVYAPALVTFFGLGLAAGLTAAALSHRDIGWVPLGPGEPFHPYYHAPLAYDRRLNQLDVRDVNHIDFQAPAHFDPDRFANRGAATYASPDDMRRGIPINRLRPQGNPFPIAAAGPMPRLPDPVPLARLHPAAPPHPDAFADRPNRPPMTIQPGTAPQNFAGPPRPSFGANPGYHPPPPLPGVPFSQQHMPNVYSPGPYANAYHPPAPPHQNLPQIYRPDTPSAPDDQFQRPRQLPNVYQPDAAQPPAYRPPAPLQYHPPQPPVYQPPAYRPPPQQQDYRPQSVQQPHYNPPPMQQPHFNPPPAPRPAPPPAGSPWNKKQGQG